MKYTQVLILLGCKFGEELYYLLIFYCIHGLIILSQILRLMKKILLLNLVLELVWQVLLQAWLQAKFWAQVNLH